jgi:Zn-dependent protease with chaperone function
MTGADAAHAPAPADGRWVASLPKSEARATFFDGTTSHKHDVTLAFGPALEIIADGEILGRWPYDEIRRADGAPGKLRLSAVGALPLARLEIVDGATCAEILARCSRLGVRNGGRRQTWRIIVWSAAAVCSIVLMAMYGIPYAADRLAPLVPFSFEKRIGESVDPQVRAMLGGKVCDSPEGQAAFAALVGKLKTAGGIEIPLDARVLSATLPNAFALPGGRVYLTNGLLQKANNVDEIAGVLAHELGHVHNRDVLRTIIQNGGTSFLVGLLFGDVTGASAVIFAGRSILDASYSRATEQSADNFAATVMRGLGRSPRPMGELLLRVTGEEKKKSITILASHPLSEDRLETLKKNDRPATGPELLTAQEWRALKDVCRGN